MSFRRLVPFLLILIATSASARNLYIPAAGRAAGANNTFFRTDVRIFNPSAINTISVSVHYLPRGLDGSNIPGRLVNIPPRQMVVLDDIVGGFLGMPSPTIGAIRLDSDTDKDYAVIADSRTYTDSPTPGFSGTFGQYVPAFDVSQAMTQSVVLHLSHSLDLKTGYRANAGVMNPNRVSVTVTPSWVLPDDTLVMEGAPIVVPPMSMVQMSMQEMFGVARAVENGYIAFASDKPVFTFGSVVDNRSGDQIFIPGQEDKAEVRSLPGF